MKPVKARVRKLKDGWYGIYHPAIRPDRQGRRRTKARNPQMAAYRAECLSKLIPVKHGDEVEWVLPEEGKEK